MNKHLKTAVLLLLDILIYIGACSLYLFFGKQGITAINELWLFIVIGLALMVLLNFALKVYSIMLRYAGFNDGIRLLIVATVMTAYHILVEVSVVGAIGQLSTIISVVLFFGLFSLFIFYCIFRLPMLIFLRYVQFCFKMKMFN